MKIVITITPSGATIHGSFGKAKFGNLEEMLFQQFVLGPQNSTIIHPAKALLDEAEHLSYSMASIRPVKQKAISPEAQEIVAIYNAYPRKVGRPVALKAIVRAIDRIKKKATKIDAAEWLFDRTCEYAQSVAGKDMQYIPHPATWFNQERYNDAIEDFTEETTQIFR